MTLKITGGHLKGRKIRSPNNPTTRPTLEKTRTAVFDILSLYIEDADFLDLFAGSGAVGIEALSRGAKKTTFVEKNPKVASLIKKNCFDLEITDQTQVIIKSVETAIKQFQAQSTKFNIIFIDPPYAMDMSKIYDALDEHSLLSENGRLILESNHSIKHDFRSFSLIKEKKYGDTYLSIYTTKKDA